MFNFKKFFKTAKKSEYGEEFMDQPFDPNMSKKEYIRKYKGSANQP